MHDSVHDFAHRVIKPEYVVGKTVLEVGSYFVNGTLRPWIQWMKPSCYVGVDVRPGPGVDRVVSCEKLTDEMLPDAWDLVVCTETLEHVSDWRRCITELAAAVRPGGYLLLTTRTPEPDVVLDHDHWVFTSRLMKDALVNLGLSDLVVEDDPEIVGVLSFAHKAGPHSMGHLADVRVTKVKGLHKGGCDQLDEPFESKLTAKVASLKAS